MSVYEALKDVLKLAQKVDNIELVRQIIDVQAQAVEMQDYQQKQSRKISELEKEIESLKEMKKLVFAEGENYLIDPEHPDRHLCPLCTKQHNTPVPLEHTYCRQCKGNYDQ